MTILSFLDKLISLPLQLMCFILLVSCISMSVKLAVEHFYQPQNGGGIQYRFLGVNWLQMMGRC